MLKKIKRISNTNHRIQKNFTVCKRNGKKNGSNLYFVYLPEYLRYKNNYDNSNYVLVKSIVNELGIPFIDINKKVFDFERN